MFAKVNEIRLPASMQGGRVRMSFCSLSKMVGSKQMNPISQPKALE
jgi:hypothetical protein